MNIKKTLSNLLNKNTKITYDKECKAIYMRFTDKEVVRTDEVVKNNILLDVDKDGAPVGVEFL